MKRTIVTIGLILALGACAQDAGHEVDGGAFGNATMNNTLIMTGQKSYAVSLQNRFAAEVPTTINFAFDSAVINAEAARILDQQANWIRQFPEVRFRVYGHTDAVGSAAYNKQLGKRRAQAVVNYLASRGISRSRLEALVSYGESQPLVPTPNRERRNRRTVTEVSGFVQSHPTVLDGKYAQIVYREYVESATSPTKLTSDQSGGSSAQ
ncbi:OmpA family protein [Jhaorihella thermophila]|uniref:Outer membrane protein OmpA n=1 Tax=Jhaorihella thermophila TaxID=488547 RepID=A0A1H5XCD2_9RHOB|nr:OmpA family protein [Jhaorihella thermophila]SEG09100.1 Outer membrane protein OmpA [Jhaorihella thermophila]